MVRSTFANEKVENTSRPEHFWKLRCRKSARRCGAKHISKSKCTKPTMFGPLLKVELSKKCTPLWREAHFEVKMLKTPGVRTTFGGSGVVSRGRRKANLMAFYLAYLLAFYLAYLLAFYLAFGVQRCALNSEGPRLRSSGAH